MNKKNSNTIPDDKKEAGNAADAQVKIAAISARTAVIVAVLGLIGTLATLLFNYIQSFHPTTTPFPPPSNPTVIITIPESTITPLIDTTLPVLTLIDTPTLESVLSETSTPTNTLPIPTTTSSLPIGMQVVLTANKTSGRAPLKVNFNAKDSYLRSADGTIYRCGACNYTWSIRQDSTSIFGPEKTEGTLEYNFGKKGSYFVTVYVCRNSSDKDCAADGITIDVK